MNLGFELTPEQQLAVTVEEHTQQILNVEASLKELREIVRGNGDPRKSLLWLVGDLGSLITAQSKLTEAHAAALETHVSTFHSVKRRSSVERFWWSVLDHVASAIVLFVLGIIGVALLGGYLSHVCIQNCR